MYYTTLNKIREHHPCRKGWRKLLKYLNKNQVYEELLSLKVILDSNGVEDAIWALRTIDDQGLVQLFAVRCVRQVQHLLIDERSIHALDVSERSAIGEASDEELGEARGTALSAWFKYPAYTTERYAAWAAAATAAAAAADTVGGAARAASDAAWGAAWAASVAARAAARDGAEDTAWADAREEQRRDFIAMFCKE